MQKDEIIRLAREANLPACHASHPVALGRFAALVAAAERERIIAANAPEIEKINAHIKALEEAVVAEREACAKVCEAVGNQDANTHAWDAAAAIRARNNK